MKHPQLIAGLTLTVALGSSAVQPISDALELVVDIGHGDAVRHVVFSKDDSLLFSAGDDGTVRIWNVHDGTLLRVIAAHAARVSSLSLCPNASAIVTAGDDRAARVWAVATGALLHEESFEATPAVTGCVADSRMLAGLDQEIRVGGPAGAWDVARIDAGTLTPALAFSNEGHLAASTGREVRVYDVQPPFTETHRITTTANATEPTISGDFLSVRTPDGIRVYELTIATRSLPNTPFASPDAYVLDGIHQRFAAVRGQTITMRDLASGTSKDTAAPSGVYVSMAVAGSGSTVALGGADGVITLIDLDAGQRLRRFGSGRTAILDAVFAGDHLNVMTSDPAGVRLDTLGAEESLIALRDSSPPRSGRWLPRVKRAVGLAALQLSAWDIERERRVLRHEVSSIEGWPLSCTTQGVCAWEDTENHAAVVQDIVKNGPVRRFSVGDENVVDLDLSANGLMLAAAVTANYVRLWDVASGRELRRLPLETRPTGLLGVDIGRSWTRFPRLVMPAAGMATAVKFSTDGRMLAAANDEAIHVWNELKAAGTPQLLRGHGRTFALAWSSDDRLFSAGIDRRLHLWNRATPRAATIISTLSRAPQSLAVSPDGKLLTTTFADAQLEVWDAVTKTLKLTVAMTPTGWIAASPDGRFDSSEDAWRHARWRRHGVTTTVYPMERFYRDYFYPGLVGEVLTGTYRPVAAGPPEALDRDTPAVAITELATIPATAELVPGEGIIRHPERVRFRVTASGRGPTRAVAGLAVTVNGVVVRKWPSSREEIGDVAEEFELPMAPAGTRVTAYAFNGSGIRSEEAASERPMNGSGYLVPQATLHALVIGVGKHVQHAEMALAYVSNDTALVKRTLERSAVMWPALAKRIADPKNAADPGFLYRSPLPQTVASRLDVTMLNDEAATRAAILDKLGELVRQASAADTVIVYYAGHGRAVGDRFFLIPYDARLSRPISEMTNAEVTQAAGSLISAEDLETVLLPLNVAHGALIFDACQSGEAVSGAEQRGPLSVPGLGRLAYEKGLNLLAAAEGNQPAFELAGLKHGIVTYTLFHEGLQEGRADVQPRDGFIDLGEWLRYGASRARAVGEQRERGNGDALQRPRFAPRRLPSDSVFLLAAGSGR